MYSRAASEIVLHINSRIHISLNNVEQQAHSNAKPVPTRTINAQLIWNIPNDPLLIAALAPLVEVAPPVPRREFDDVGVVAVADDTLEPSELRAEDKSDCTDDKAEDAEDKSDPDPEDAELEPEETEDADEDKE